MSDSRNIVFRGVKDADKFQDEHGNQLAPHNVKIKCLSELCPSAKQRTKKERTIKTQIAFTSDEQSFEAAVLLVLKREDISALVYQLL